MDQLLRNMSGNSTFSLLGSEGLQTPEAINSECTDSLLAALASVRISEASSITRAQSPAKAWEEWVVRKEHQSRQRVRTVLVKRRVNHKFLYKDRPDYREKRSKESQLHWKKWVILKNEQISAQMKAKNLEGEIQRISQEKTDQTKKEEVEISYSKWLERKRHSQKRKLEEERKQEALMEGLKISRAIQAEMTYKQWLSEKKRCVEGFESGVPIPQEPIQCWRDSVSVHHVDVGCGFNNVYVPEMGPTYGDDVEMSQG